MHDFGANFGKILDIYKQFSKNIVAYNSIQKSRSSILYCFGLVFMRVIGYGFRLYVSWRRSVSVSFPTTRSSLE